MNEVALSLSSRRSTLARMSVLASLVVNCRLWSLWLRDSTSALGCDGWTSTAASLRSTPCSLLSRVLSRPADTSLTWLATRLAMCSLSADWVS